MFPNNLNRKNVTHYFVLYKKYFLLILKGEGA